MPRDLIDRFAAGYFTLNSISPKRRVHTIRTLRRYERFLRKPPLRKPIEQADDRDLRSYLVTLLDRDLMASTVCWHLHMIKPFYRWCHQERIIDRELWLHVQAVEPPRGSYDHEPKPYSQDELARMWKQLNKRWPYRGSDISLLRFRTGTSHYRNVKKHAMRLQLDAMIELALVCGLRQNEIACLSIDDCHWDNEYIVVHGKRKNQHDRLREVPFPETTREAVKRWWRMRVQLKPKHDGLWLSVTGPDPARPLRKARMEMLLHSFGDWRWHRLRHTCATERLRAGMSIPLLQQFLGHTSIQTTMRYIKLVRTDVHDAAARTDAEFQRAIGRAA